MSELALRLIAENKKTKAISLDLGNCGLTELPNELFDCVWLEALNLGKYISSKNRGKTNKFETISSKIRKLSSLRVFSCVVLGLTDISFLQYLPLLQALSLEENLVHDISVLKYLENLTNLSLNRNNISNISALRHLKKLERLSLIGNTLADAKVLSELPQLQSLSISHNQITNISFLKNLTEINFLLLSSNKLTNISSLRNLTKLKTLWIENNQIQDLSPILHLFQNGVKINFSNNPIINPPIEIVNQGNGAITAYFEKQNKIPKHSFGMKPREQKEPSLSVSVEKAYVLGFGIKNFRGVDEIKIENIPAKSPWIFLTGENGFGKTSILQGIAKALTEKDSNLAQKVVAYGSSRLRVSAGISKEAAEEYSSINSLFSNDTLLIDIEERIKDWHRDYTTGFLKLQKVFTTLLPRLGRIDVEFNPNTKSREVRYFETDESGDFYGQSVTYEQLAAGYKNIIAMIGDMVYRLSLTQEVKELKDLSGIVLIDEIELHLHAKYQKLLVEKLTELFPKIQFIVSTHSVMPILGSPKNSCFISVNRSPEMGINAKIINIDPSVLTPNILFTSPLFGMDHFFSSHINDENFGDVRTEESYEEMLKNISTAQAIKNL